MLVLVSYNFCMIPLVCALNFGYSNPVDRGVLRLLMIVSFLLWLVPATLDTVVQVTNSIAVNRIAQGEEV